MADLENRSTTGTTPAPLPSSNSTAIQDTQIARLITDLMAHYWTPDVSPATRTAAIKDWIVDLREFPSSFVAAACRDWRQSNTRRPTPADIRLLCIAEQRARKPASPPPLRVTDMHREAMPAADVVRDGWRKIPRSLLTDAERQLFDASGLKATKRALTVIGTEATHAVPLAAHEDRRPKPRIAPHTLPSEDDPAVQEQLRQMGNA